MRILYETLDGKSFTDKKQAKIHEEKIFEDFLKENSIIHTKEDFYKKRRQFVENGQKCRKFGEESYKIDNENYTFIDGEGQIIGLVVNGIVYEDYNLNRPLRVTIATEKLKEFLETKNY